MNNLEACLMSDLAFASATKLGGLLKKREISSSELLELWSSPISMTGQRWRLQRRPAELPTSVGRGAFRSAENALPPSGLWPLGAAVRKTCRGKRASNLFDLAVKQIPIPAGTVDLVMISS